jgi:hypothetical protein
LTDHTVSTASRIDLQHNTRAGPDATANDTVQRPARSTIILVATSDMVIILLPATTRSVIILVPATSGMVPMLAMATTTTGHSCPQMQES